MPCAAHGCVRSGTVASCVTASRRNTVACRPRSIRARCASCANGWRSTTGWPISRSPCRASAAARSRSKAARRSDSVGCRASREVKRSPRSRYPSRRGLGRRRDGDARAFDGRRLSSRRHEDVDQQRRRRRLLLRIRANVGRGRHARHLVLSRPGRGARPRDRGTAACHGAASARATRIRRLRRRCGRDDRRAGRRVQAGDAHARHLSNVGRCGGARPRAPGARGDYCSTARCARWQEACSATCLPCAQRLARWRRPSMRALLLTVSCGVAAGCDGPANDRPRRQWPR